MLSKEEKELIKIKQELNEIPVPSKIDSYILAGVEKAKHEKRKAYQKPWVSSLAVCAVLFLSIISIQISPDLARLASQVPGVDFLIEFILGDQGLDDALNNDYKQIVGVSDTKEGITFTVDQIIADESRLLIFYSITSDKTYHQFDIGKVELLDENREPLEVSYSYGGIMETIGKGETIREKIDINLMNYDMPSELTVTVGINGTGLDDETWTVTFPIDREKFTGNQIVYPVNHTVLIEGQKITFKEITIYPTQIAVHVQFDEENTMEIFSFDDLMVLDEKGNERASIQNGITAHYLNDDEQIIYLESNYFTDYEELYLQFTSVRALEKENLDVVIDLEEGTLLARPNDQMELMELNKGNENIHLRFSIGSTNPFDNKRGYQIFQDKYYDDKGNEYEFSGHGSSLGSLGNHWLEIPLDLPIKNLINSSTLKLKINDYPTRIQEDIKFKIN